jgi:hypothetical protein
MSAKNIIDTETVANHAAIFQAVEAGILELRLEYKLRYREAGFTLDLPSQSKSSTFLNQLVYTKVRGAQWSAFPAASLTTYIGWPGDISVRFSNVDMRNSIDGYMRVVRYGSEHAFEFSRWFTVDDSYTTVPADERETVKDDGARVATALAYYGQALDTILQKLAPQ